MAVARGTVLRFDQVKGYGFVAPDSGGEDLFLHVNDLLEDKHVIHAGAVVEFVPAQGERGLKATEVHLVQPRVVPSLPAPPFGPGPASAVAGREQSPDDSDELADVLTRSEFRHEVTELLLAVEPTLTGAQVLRIREQLAGFCGRHGWLSD